MPAAEIQAVNSEQVVTMAEQEGSQITTGRIAISDNKGIPRLLWFSVRKSPGAPNYHYSDSM